MSDQVPLHKQLYKIYDGIHQVAENLKQISKSVEATGVAYDLNTHVRNVINAQTNILDGVATTLNSLNNTIVIEANKGYLWVGPGKHLDMRKTRNPEES